MAGKYYKYRFDVCPFCGAGVDRGYPLPEHLPECGPATEWRPER